MSRQSGASDFVARSTSVVLALVATTALVGVVVRGDIGLALDTVSLVMLGSLPVARVATLAVRWARDGDAPFAAAAAALLALMVIGVVVVTAWR